MKAAFINRTGAPDVITFGELPKPTPSETGVLVRVEAVDVNPIDTYVRGGMVAAKLAMPHIIGADLAGTVEAVGEKVTRFKPGDRVWGSNQGQHGRAGTFAEYAAVDEKWLYATPEGVSSEAAVALSLVGITARLGLSLVPPADGETLFVNGGSGGVGNAVVQMAKAMGARVATTAGNAEKVKRCQEAGADLAINYKSQDVDAQLKDFAPKGLNIWWETLREIDLDRVVGLLAVRGRVVLMAGRNARPTLPVGPVYVKNCSLHGFAMFNFSADEQRAAADDINRWHAEGKLKPNIDRVLPLDEAAAAHELQESSTIHQSGTLTGKIVLRP